MPQATGFLLLVSGIDFNEQAGARSESSIRWSYNPQSAIIWFSPLTSVTEPILRILPGAPYFF